MSLSTRGASSGKGILAKIFSVCVGYGGLNLKRDVRRDCHKHCFHIERTGVGGTYCMYS